MTTTADLTADWLTAVLSGGTAAGFRTERIGTARMSECDRVAPTYAGHDSGLDSVVLKVAASDPISRQAPTRIACARRSS